MADTRIQNIIYFHECTSGLEFDGVHNCITATWEKIIGTSWHFSFGPSALLAYDIVWQIMPVSLTRSVSEPFSCSWL